MPPKPPQKPLPKLSAPPDQWTCLDTIASYAEQWLQELGLDGWTFAWDRAVRRLGSCDGGKKRITLSKHFALHYIGRDAQTQHIITDTLLHELAHALVWQRHKIRGHDVIWRHYCALLGIPNERSCTNCESFDQSPARYELIIQATGEVIRSYSRKPRITPARLKKSYIPGRKDETMGKLAIRTVQARPL